MLIDYTLYNGEIELLQLRYNYYKDYIEQFIIVEANYTFTGIYKQFSLEKDLKRCNIPTDNIAIIKVDLQDSKLNIGIDDVEYANLVGNNDPLFIKFLARKKIQRNSLTHILEKFDEDSIFLISDIDEFVNVDKLDILVTTLCKYNNQTLKIPLVYLNESADKRLVDQYNFPILYDDKLTICNKRHLLEIPPSAVRQSNNQIYPPIKITVNEEVDFNYGWLFDNMGDITYKTIKRQSNHSDNNVSTDKKYYVDYNQEQLPYQIFHYPKVKKFLLPSSEPIKFVDYTMVRDEKDLFRFRYKLYKDKIDLFVIVSSPNNFDGSFNNTVEFQTQKSFVKFCKKYDIDLKKVRLEIYKLPDSLLPKKRNIDNVFSMYPEQSGTNPIEDGVIFASTEAYKFLDENDSIKPYNYLNQSSKLIWVREKFIRNYLNLILNDFTDHTFFLVSDVDEILNPKFFTQVFSEISTNDKKILKIPLVYLEFRTDRRLLNDDGSIVDWDKGMFLCSKNILLSNTPNNIRDEFNLNTDIFYIKENDQRLNDMGWHINFLDDDVNNRYKSIIYSYSTVKITHPISLHLVNYLQNLTGSMISASNFTSLESLYNDNEILNYSLFEKIPLDFCKSYTNQQKAAYFSLKYNDIIKNKLDYYKTYKTIFSYLGKQSKVVDFSANLGIALRAAFDTWVCEIYGYEYEKVLFSRIDYYDLYQNIDTINKSWIKTLDTSHQKFVNLSADMLPILLINDLEKQVPKNKCSLALFLDLAQYFDIDDNRKIIKGLTENSDLILFSCANPARPSINAKTLRWQSYWIEEFKKYGYNAYELRDKLQDLSFVPNFLKTELIVFSKNDVLSPMLKPNLYVENTVVKEFHNQ